MKLYDLLNQGHSFFSWYARCDATGKYWHESSKTVLLLFNDDRVTHNLLLGGIIIGLEMGTVYSTLGARLDVVEMMDGLGSSV